MSVRNTSGLCVNTRSASWPFRARAAHGNVAFDFEQRGQRAEYHALIFGDDDSDRLARFLEWERQARRFFDRQCYVEPGAVSRVALKVRRAPPPAHACRAARCLRLGSALSVVFNLQAAVPVHTF